MKAIPPTYASPRPPPNGKPLTKRQKITLAVAIIIVFLLVVVILPMILHLLGL